jgi:hypothetical protein
MSTEDATPDTGISDAAARPIPAEVLAATKGARTVLAPTDDGRDDAYRQGRAAAIALCAAHKAELILVDRATESWWIDPYGSGNERNALTDPYPPVAITEEGSPLPNGPPRAPTARSAGCTLRT